MISFTCATFDAFEAKIIQVEATQTKGLPSFSIVGMPSSAITESKERVKSALLSNDFKFPPRRITINLSPSDIRKEGSHFDLAIALAVALEKHQEHFNNFSIFGELGLDGSLKENATLFALLLSLAEKNLIYNVIVPLSSVEKFQNIPNINVLGFAHFNEVLEFLQTPKEIKIEKKTLTKESLHVEIDSNKYYYQHEYPYDFIDVKAQEIAKRAALISAVGMHNILFEGSPGCGKSMIAKRIRYILAPMNTNEILNVAKLESLALKEPTFLPLRNFQSPHHTSTAASIFGGGSQKAMIGEVGLSDGGILFFDELPHYSKNVLEALREPLEDNSIRISRVHSKIEYRANFLFIGAMNPCPCGNLLHQELTCRCSDLEIQRYKNRLSDPFLDRIDLHVKMQNIEANDKSSLSSKEMHTKVIEAFSFQKERKQLDFNAKLSEKDIEKYCILEDHSKEKLEFAIRKFNLSYRAINKIKTVARSIADLDKSITIKVSHLLEALSYRKR